MSALDAITRLLLDRIQRSFPLVPQPYAALAAPLAIGEAEVRARIALLKRRGLVRQISAIFNTGSLGYRSSLVAMAVPDGDLTTAVAAVNAYPGVSHNYLRPAPYNLWFTIAVPPGESLEQTVAALARAAGGWPVLVLPALKKYKLAVVLDVLEEGEGDVAERAATPRTEARSPFPVTRRHVRIVRCIQEDLPLTDRPFADWAEALGMAEGELLACVAEWLERGYMRRFAAVLNHRRVGFSANGMVVWACPDRRLDECGRALAACGEVSHCYHRPAFPSWPYNLYAMIHGRSVAECEAVADQLAKRIALPGYRILFSSQEFKKIRLKLFWQEPSGEVGG